jgi:hypothetical protein
MIARGQQGDEAVRTNQERNAGEKERDEDEAISL